MDIINEILTKGEQINSNLNGKIKLLNDRNTTFYGELKQRLTNILLEINNFKDTNLQGLTETKNQLTAVTTELENTRRELDKTKSELDNVRAELLNVQSQLQESTISKNELEGRVRELEKDIQRIDEDYQKQMDTIKQEMNNTLSQEKNALQEEHDKQIAALQQEKNNLLDQINEAKKNEEEAINNLSKLQDDQNSLIEKLGTINQVLAKQLETIDTISIDQPNINAYSDLLTGIEAGLKGVMGGINQAVANTSGTQPLANKSVTQSYDAEANYNNLRNLIQTYRDPPDLLKYLSNNVDLTKLNKGEKYILSMVSSPQNKQSIIDILNKYKLNIPNTISGGKRKRKRRTMKKRSKKTRKLRKKYQKGGYTYSASKELDKASSIVSNSSVSNYISNSGTKSRTIRNKKKSRKRSRK
jgi:hypothetical protein